MTASTTPSSGAQAQAAPAPAQLEGAEHAWLARITTLAAHDTRSAEIQETRARELEAISTEIAALSDELREANAALTIDVERRRALGKLMGRRMGKQMGWMTGNRDTEVDTVHDLGAGIKTDQAAVDRVMRLHGELVKLQTRMETAEVGGESVFDAKDITRELWTPLVRAHLIPSNAVADTYSQEAQVFRGACELYKERLETYTEGASRFETVQRAIRITKNASELIGTVATEAIKLDAFDGTFISTKDTTQNLKDKTVHENANTKFGEDDQLTKDFKGKLDDFNERKEIGATANRDMAIAKLATAATIGGLTVLEKGLDHDKSASAKLWKLSETTYGVFEGAALKSLDVWSTSVVVDDLDESKRQGWKTLSGRIKAGLRAGMIAGRFVFDLHEIATSDNKLKASKALIGRFADLVAAAVAIGDVPSGKTERRNPETGETETVTDPGTAGQFAKIGALLKAGILAGSNASALAELVVRCARTGTPPSPAMIAKAVGLAALTAGTTALAGAAETVSTATRERVDPPEDQEDVLDADEVDLGGAPRVYRETTIAKEKREAAISSTIGDISSLMPSLMAAFDPTKGLPDETSVERKMVALQKAEEAKRKEAELTGLKAMMQDKGYREALIKGLSDEADAGAEEVRAMVDAVSPLELDPDDPHTLDRAEAAMDALLKEAAACNARWKIMIALTNGGASALVAALPAAGLAKALVKLATDVAILARRSYHCNRWRKNMALTAGNDSVYGPAIRSRLNSAIVQVSEQAARVIWDAIGVGLEGLKIADASGVASVVGAAAHGGESALTMARALTEFGYKMRKEHEIRLGWKHYKSALANPGDRKIARKAMKWNSTLSKCVLAYGIVEDRDPIAQQVARSCKMTPEQLADHTEICPKVVRYFETLYSDDPVVMHRIPINRSWHPGQPELTPVSWARFKGAALAHAVPPLSEASTATSAVDRALAKLTGLLGGTGDYESARDRLIAQHPAVTGAQGQQPDPVVAFLTQVGEAAGDVVAALESYAPVCGPCPEAADGAWREGAPHEDMAEIVRSLVVAAKILQSEAGFDLETREAIASQTDVSYEDARLLAAALT